MSDLEATRDHYRGRWVTRHRNRVSVRGKERRTDHRRGEPRGTTLEAAKNADTRFLDPLPHPQEQNP